MWLPPPPPPPGPTRPREALVAFDDRAAYVHRPGTGALVRSVVAPPNAWVIAASYSAPLQGLLVLYREPTRYRIARLRLAANGKLRAISTWTLPGGDRRYSDLAADPKRAFVYLGASGRGIASYTVGPRGLERGTESEPAVAGEGRLVLSPDGRTALLLQNDSFLDNQFGAVTSYRRPTPGSPRFRKRTSIDLNGIGTGGGAFTPDGHRAYVVGWFSEILVLAVDPEGRLKIRRRGGEARSTLAYDPVSRTVFTATGPFDQSARAGRFSVENPDHPRLVGRKQLGNGGELVVSARNRALYQVSDGVRVVAIAPDGALGRTPRFFRAPSRLTAPALVPMPPQ